MEVLDPRFQEHVCGPNLFFSPRVGEHEPIPGYRDHTAYGLKPWAYFPMFAFAALRHIPIYNRHTSVEKVRGRHIDNVGCTNVDDQAEVRFAVRVKEHSAIQ